jgi:hypothetical protein
VEQDASGKGSQLVFEEGYLRIEGKGRIETVDYVDLIGYN